MMLKLANGAAEAVVAPEAGGRVTSLRIDGFEVVAELEPPEHEPVHAWYGGIFPLAPWCGRLPTPWLDWRGVRRLLPGGPSPTHGYVADQAWVVMDADATSARLGCGLAPRWPFRGHVELVLELGGSDLFLRLEHHADGEPQPSIGGFHPWLRREEDGSLPRFGFAAGARLAPDAERGWRRQERLEPDAMQDDPARPWDDLFTDVTPSPWVQWRCGPRVELVSDSPCWVFYERDPRAFCIEPWTAAPEALGSPSCPIAAPGRPHVTELRLNW